MRRVPEYDRAPSAKSTRPRGDAGGGLARTAPWGRRGARACRDRSACTGPLQPPGHRAVARPPRTAGLPLARRRTPGPGAGRGASWRLRLPALDPTRMPAVSSCARPARTRARSRSWRRSLPGFAARSIWTSISPPSTGSAAAIRSCGGSPRSGRVASFAERRSSRTSSTRSRPAMADAAAAARIAALGRRCPAAPELRAFPEPRALARMTVRRLDERTGLGSRARVVSAIATLYPDPLEHLPRRRLSAQLARIAGVDRATLAWLMLLLGHHDRPVLDGAARPLRHARVRSGSFRRLRLRTPDCTLASLERPGAVVGAVARDAGGGASRRGGDESQDAATAAV